MVFKKHINDPGIYRKYQKLVSHLLTVGGYDWEAAAAGLQMGLSTMQITPPTDRSVSNSLSW